MARKFAGNFYSSKAWIECRKGFMESKNYICERCGRAATIAHHKIYLNENNIDDPNISLNWNLLECLCLTCHGKEHGSKPTRTGLEFDENGNIISHNNKKERKVIVILGLPASGKTTYVKENLGINDMVLDLDRLVEALTFQDGHIRVSNTLNAVEVSNDIFKNTIANLRQGKYIYDNFYIIRTKLSNSELETLQSINAEFYLIDTKETICKKRLEKQGRENLVGVFAECSNFYFENKNLIKKIYPPGLQKK